ncbi:hypothetical protein GCM10011600_11700 [Pseudolysinimonas yzui]|uniref:IrrE N-terminal-like domain-containing protein n=1 Tax=Pseudolysinimonas yzui TaxID=2708254 RepID=A0A8J3M022_9MICO|nr:hypothetical protein GCM10011600_11700 [Pseudolysinimonas yzui]
MIPVVLGLSRRETLESVTAAVERIRGKPTIFKPVDWLEGTGATGLWLPFEDVDEVLYLPTRSQLYRTQILLHELSHMILGHDRIFAASANRMALIAGEYTTRALSHALARSTDRNEYEVAAEALADELAAVIRSGPAEPAWFEGVLG